ncbi:pentatricopeptide repeat-containing protein At2g22410, mitochondrial-like isoform X2 [Phragmites australis]|uniref:pentatricopeptide repeat-containing protein At2g22410, mitochondrial-like isoform X2 n=1 Tax=Phragmites australis TaxID=29695 RepID=UPI002D778AE2|nr:pentatricopeptide repeat-containing protein At2g22410, mitochondrial-like isoform X2 [Phragmites australis]
MHPFTLSSTALLRLIKSLSPAVAGSHLSALAIHCLLFKEGLLHAGAHLPTALLSAYAALGSPRHARDLFDEMPDPGLVTRTAMARAHAASGQAAQALTVFRDMVADGVLPDNVALAVALAACHGVGSSSVARNHGKMVHALIVTSGIVPDVFVSTELIRVYGECGEVSVSRRVFDQMPVRSTVSWNAMVHQYVRHGNVDSAYELFLAMPRRDVVSWNTMMAGYCVVGRSREALGLFRQMVSPSSCPVRPNGPTMSTVLAACAGTGCLETGIWVHAYIDRNRMNYDGSLDRSLIDMYSKCGNIEKALQVFDKAPGKRDLYSWTTVICGLAMHGRAADALRMFNMMQDNGIHPDDVTLVGVLNACAHGGLVDEGLCYFYSMEKYAIAPKIEHYGCMIDLLGRVGRVQEAYSMIRTMPMKPNAVIWGAFLSACKVHSNVELGEIAAAEVSRLEPDDPWARVMLSSMYAKVQDWSGLARERREVNSLQVKKTPGCSSIELDGQHAGAGFLGLHK